MTVFHRDMGVLVHPTSLPGPYRIGDLGQDTLRWVRTVREMGLSLWQVLPLNPPGPGNSPYQARSTFAGDTRLISLGTLVEQGLLTQVEVQPLVQEPSAAPIDFERVDRERAQLLSLAAERFVQRGGARSSELEEFRGRQASWLSDYAEFATLRTQQNARVWNEWPAPLRDRLPGAMREARRTLAKDIEREVVLQFFFDQQWQRVRQLARELGVRIVGDIPIFVALDCADVWAHPELFRLDEQGQPDVIAGVPPDYFSATGQRWGNPLYDWDVHQATAFAWWLERLAHVLAQADVVRIDHFRGFAAYWEIPSSEPTAIGGRWVEAPGDALFQAVQQRFGAAPPIIAEDLGLITDDVIELRERYGFPGMRVLQFSFGGEAKDLPDAYPEDSVAYTATHDNDTTVGWYYGAPEGDPNRTVEEIAAERDRVRRYFHTDGTDMQWTCIHALARLPVSAVLFPIQGILGQGSERRTNTPGTMGGTNWAYRMTWQELQPWMVERVRQIAQETGRGVFR